MEFDDVYQASISKIMAETQRIQEITNLLEGEKIIAETNKQIATLNAAIALSDAQTAGNIYASIREATAIAQTAFNSEVVKSITTVRTFGATTSAQQLQFFYLVVVYCVIEGDEDDTEFKETISIPATINCYHNQSIT